MINPEDELPLDDLEDGDKDDQRSQQDVHSNGLDEERIPSPESDEPPTDLLNQSFRASESSYTLNYDNDEPPAKKDKE
ncbi:hypothetical protein SNE25_05840 [Mucilaginibacter sabulilitoris]|uniref:Uncharacterized protein n=1 Tax=Mucilaginibacter sabulilitoris TaxID=1173583 RepID=A0ABZ0TTD4_9SPHI|nr:hypothetical protein [Mucilaginibacter sabulilitoris]WPU95044.1 hypothetical protein SNE25_05840 [Mucilaginibacter sabulilitoris]